jgi:hypothetical protein
MTTVTKKYTFDPMAIIKLGVSIWFAAKGWISWYIFILLIIYSIDLPITWEKKQYLPTHHNREGGC